MFANLRRVLGLDSANNVTVHCHCPSTHRCVWPNHGLEYCGYGGMAFETEDDLISEWRNWFDNLDVDIFRLLNDYNLLGAPKGNGTWIADTIFPGYDLDFKLAQFFRDCGEGKTLYSALQLSETELTVDNLIFKRYREIFETIGPEVTKDVDFIGTYLHLPELITFLDTMASIDGKLQYRAFQGVLQQNPAALTTKFQRNLKAHIRTITNPTEKKKVSKNVAEMRAITRPTPSNNLTNKCSNLKSLLININATVAQLTNETLNETLSLITERVAKIESQSAAGLESSMSKELGVCKPLYDIYDDIFVKTLCKYALGSLIAWLCAMGMTAVFLLLTTCFSCKLSKHLYRVHCAAGMRVDSKESYKKVGQTWKQIKGKSKPTEAVDFHAGGSADDRVSMETDIQSVRGAASERDKESERTAARGRGIGSQESSVSDETSSGGSKSVSSQLDLGLSKYPYSSWFVQVLAQLLMHGPQDSGSSDALWGRECWEEGAILLWKIRNPLTFLLCYLKAGQNALGHYLPFPCVGSRKCQYHGKSQKQLLSLSCGRCIPQLRQ
ncbi:prominin-1-a [Plakobranchus ocellatus]|uniref:Prominin-1-a n=1 Tax=Plakobranchus ocellatus TaxID=259542 RepID=A0AAV4B6B2_9GAST|nr:prominin-1-a [Plakobranchus ocellatus]